MANPVIMIGHPGTSQYRVDWKPQYQGLADFGRGISQGVDAWREGKDREDERRQKVLKESTLAEVMAGNMDAQERMSKLGSAGFSPREIFQTERSLELSRPKTPETFETIKDPYGRGGVGQRSSRSGQISGYQGPLPQDKPTQRRIVKGADDFNYYDDTKERVFPGLKATPKGDGAKPFETEQKLRKEYSGESDVFRKTQDSFRRVVSSADGKSAAGDMALIFNFMKTLDPGSVVRESEFALAASAGSFGQQIKAAADKVMTGQRLTPVQRADFMQTATRAYMGQADQQERRRVQYSNIAHQYGLDPGRALVDYLDMDMLKRFGQPQGQPAPVREGLASDRFANNDWRGPPQSAPAQASLMSAQARNRPTPAPVRKDLFGTPGQPSGGRGGGDEFASPFDGSGLAPPGERRQHPFGSMDRSALMAVDLNTLIGDPAALAAYERALDEQISGIR